MKVVNNKDSFHLDIRLIFLDLVDKISLQSYGELKFLLGKNLRDVWSILFRLLILVSVGRLIYRRVTGVYQMESPVSDGSVSRRTLRRKAASRNYDEKLMDDLIEKHLGSAKRKRNKTREDFEKETEIEAMLALSLGFPIDALLEEEIKAGVVAELGGKDQNDYIVVRNHILARWRANVRAWLSKGQIRETVSNEYEHLICSAYEFLLCNGYINFGVSPSFIPLEENEVSEGSVIIVGAGLAGLAAARQLISFGFRVMVLEGRSRPGGRVYTQKMGEKGRFAAVELGGSVITGIHANPLGVLARQLSIPLHKVRDKCPLYNPDGALIDDAMDAKIEFVFNRLLDKVTQLRQIGGFETDISLGSVLETLRQLYAVARSHEERQLLDWHLANLEYANAGCLSDLSAAYWDQDDPYEMGGDHCFLSGGNWRLIKALCDGVPILYEKTVHTIKYGYGGIEVITENQVFRADMVLCTLPLGVLKRRNVKFVPELPERKLAAIERLGFGLLNKVAMIFPHVFWGKDLDTFGCLSKNSYKRGEFFLFYSYHTVSGGPVLVALVAGEAARDFECTDPSVLLHRILNILKGIYSRKDIIVPNPIQTICTRWGSDPLSYGSYSHVRVQSSGKDYDILAESVGGRLFFAGEATSRKYPATMHGAFLSGLREASHIIKAVRGQQSYQRRYVPKSTVLNDILLDLFRKPDLAFGKFSFVFDPSNFAPDSLGVMRVTFGEERHRSSGEESFEPLQLYAVLTREQANRLQMLPGGNERKLKFVTENLGLALVGSSALGNYRSSLITSIVTARRGRGRYRVLAA